MKQLRIGYLSAAGIGKKNWKAIAHSGNCVISAVASRDVEKCRFYIRECSALDPFPTPPEPLGSYDALLASPNVDAIYIPLPTGLRRDYVLRAAAAGKHVICEKPCANNAAELEQMLAACEKHKVQFMDGVMFMHSPRLPLMREILDDGKSVGAIRRIASAFSFYPGDESFFTNNIRVNGALEPTGCLGDLGWYCIRFVLWAMNWHLPRTVTGRLLNQSKALPNRPPAPTEFAGGLQYDDTTVEFYSTFLAATQQWVHVSGQKGWLLVPDFIHPFNSHEPAFEVNRKAIHTPGTPCPAGIDPMLQGHATAQDTIMFRNFADQVFSGRLNTDWPMWSLRTQQVLDACFEAGRSGGVVKF